MDCPQCGHRAKQAEDADGGVRFFCPTCGWGLDPTGSAAVDEGPWVPKGADWLKLGLLWAVSVAVLVGPFFALWFGARSVLDVAAAHARSPVEPFHHGLIVHYWWIMLVYLLVAALFTPKYDSSDLGLFGSPFLDNPFSWSDDYNRFMMGLFFLLVPGKLVIITLKNTYRMARAATGA